MSGERIVEGLSAMAMMLQGQIVATQLAVAALLRASPDPTAVRKVLDGLVRDHRQDAARPPPTREFAEAFDQSLQVLYRALDGPQ